MDAVLAVSALAMVSAVAWAEWVMNDCVVSSDIMSQPQLVRNGQIRKTGRGQKVNILETISQIGLIFTQHLSGGLS